MFGISALGGGHVRCSFVHFGDVHLGTQQYDSPERLNDFGRAWLFACEYVARQRPDFAICAGDLFNRFTINPITFDQAYAGLSMIRDAGVPILDIQGNHDRARYGEVKSWLQSFADQGLLTYLDVDTGPDGVRLRPAGTSHHGSFVEWSGCRIVGVRYLGASTERVLQVLEPQLAELGGDCPFTILVLHAGLEGIVPNVNAELTVSAIEHLRGLVDYVALGHLHKHYIVSDYVYNGGSLETWALNEWGWERGLLHVDVDTERTPVVTYRLVDVPRRPFVIVRLDVGQYDSPRALYVGCWERLQVERRRSLRERPVAVVVLHGRLRFEAEDLDVAKLEEACRSLLDPVVAFVREQYDGREFVTFGGDDGDRPIDRAALERSILQGRLARDERYAAHAAELARVAAELKERALQGDAEPSLLAAFRQGIRHLQNPAAVDATASAARPEPVEATG